MKMKVEVTNGITISVPLDTDNLYCECPYCGQETKVELGEIVGRILSIGKYPEGMRESEAKDMFEWHNYPCNNKKCREMDKKHLQTLGVSYYEDRERRKNLCEKWGSLDYCY